MCIYSVFDLVTHISSFHPILSTLVAHVLSTFPVQDKAIDDLQMLA